MDYMQSCFTIIYYNYVFYAIIACLFGLLKTLEWIGELPSRYRKYGKEQELYRIREENNKIIEESKLNCKLMCCDNSWITRANANYIKGLEAKEKL